MWSVGYQASPTNLCKTPFGNFLKTQPSAGLVTSERMLVPFCHWKSCQAVRVLTEVHLVKSGAVEKGKLTVMVSSSSMLMIGFIIIFLKLIQRSCRLPYQHVINIKGPAELSP